MSEPRTREELEEAKSEAIEEAGLQKEREFLLKALGRNQWSVVMAAREANMPVTEFQKIMKKHHIDGKVGSTWDPSKNNGYTCTGGAS
jgi:transcriptional regulator with GAF, ATPase, and Fis domain